jgi:hypothetical protein
VVLGGASYGGALGDVQRDIGAPPSEQRLVAADRGKSRSVPVLQPSARRKGKTSKAAPTFDVIGTGIGPASA